MDYEVYVITSEATKSRKIVMDAQLRTAHMEATYIETFTVDSRHVSSILTSGELEVYSKHMEAYSRFLATDSRHALVLEDDAILPEGFPTLLRGHMPPKAFDFYFISDDHFPKPHQIISPYIIKTNASKTACAYLLGRRAAEVMLAYATSLDKPIDHKMNDVIVAHGLETYWHVGLVRHGSARGIYSSAIRHTPL